MDDYIGMHYVYLAVRITAWQGGLESQKVGWKGIEAKDRARAALYLVPVV